MMKRKKYIILLCCMLLSIDFAFAQFTVQGNVADEHQQPLENVLVSIKGATINTKTNHSGRFLLTLPKSGKYVVSLQKVGYLTLSQEINVLPSANTDLFFSLKEDIKQLNTVNISTKNAISRIKDNAIRANTIELKEVYSQPSTLIELMNRSSGVKIRQSGGLGSNTDISLNGFQGKSIRYFKDGIPLDYLGDGFSLSALPSNMLQHIEVYKGVLPVNLGADALGGAINLISRKPSTKFIEAGYEMASFNTHRLNLNTYYSDTSSNVFIGLDGFFNYSDNDYKVQVKATDPDTRNQYDATVPLFHNAYTGYFLQLYTGFKNKTWADELKLTLTQHGNVREQQHPALMTDPYGAIIAKQSSFIPALNYSKYIIPNKLKLTQFLTAGTLKINRIDTLHGSYDWFGNFTPNPLKIGESRQPSNSTIDQGNFTSRTNLVYQFSSAHQLEFNTVYTSAHKKGSDPLGPKFSGTDIDVLSVKSTYNKLVAALGLSSFLFDKKLNHQLIGKYFYYKAGGIEAYEAKPVFSDEIKKTQGSVWGIADAIKYEFNARHMLRFSMEYATRLPDQNELFGDAIFVVPNFTLKPERSFNLNLGYRFQQTDLYHVEVNSFYRRTKNLILLVPIQQPYAHYENQENVKGLGMELEGSVQPIKGVFINANVTWQDLRLFKVPLNAGGADKNNARLRNTPYFFGNLGVNYQLNRLKLYGYYNYVKEYYLETIPKNLEAGGFLGIFGSANVNSLLIIPSQHLLNGGLSYALLKQKLTASFETKNILNNQLFDNYRLQKAGRSFHFKLVYTIQ